MVFKSEKGNKMIYVFILLIMIIVDFQIIALYRYNRDRFEKTKDEKDLSSAKRWFAGSACAIIVTLASTVVIVIHQVHVLLDF